ncbi:1-acyl-sn-glycerol-3-phosphate acyltransferase [Rhodococcus pseudokoreensis]|uniref:1-acyl-sn-glycerol-3-phosphate acyltransferase n=1 Tax=Rhodococcus pseudokoreensis TaxID=2811421 RepID=A0A974ZT00_9NOCA|nr:lysophospholipid acyltransferase family protein [Rhodococcus pseudokoreensis]QSE88707.1 1-acyl-sn-glycerol-3-phosphate acyltransferase [Rhodococcus pseudokoreensis]
MSTAVSETAAVPVHSWMPSSPCGAGCLPAEATAVSIPTVVVRWCLVVSALATAPLLTAGWLLPRSWRTGLQRRYAAMLLRCVGIRLVVVDHRGKRRHDGGLLVVAGHVSWTDVLVLSALAPANFVARGDLLDWPVLGSLARRMRVVPIERQSLRALPGTVATTAGRLRGGERVVAFPEGTTWCGRAYGGFRPALFQAAIDAECPVQPISLRYTGRGGELTTGPCFVGEETIGRSIRRIIRQKGVNAEVRLAPIEYPGECRRDLAARCERAARGDERIDLAAHDIVDPLQGAVGTAAAGIEAAERLVA